MEEAKPIDKPAKARRSWGRIVLRIVGGFCLLLVLAMVVLHTSWAKEKIRARAEARLSERVLGDVSIKSIDYGFLFSDVEVRGVEIRDENGNLMIAVDGIDLNLDRWETLGGTVTIDDLQVSKLAVLVDIAEDGTHSLQRLFLKQSGKSAPILIRSLFVREFELEAKKADGDVLSIREGELQLRFDKSDTTDVFLERITFQFVHQRGKRLSISGRFEQEGATIRKTADSIAIEVEPMTTKTTVTRLGAPVEATDIHLGKSQIVLRPGRIDAILDDVVLGPLKIGTIACELSIEAGNLSGQQEVKLDEVTLDTTSLSKILNRKVPLSDAKGQVLIAGPADALVVEGQFETAEGRVEIIGEINAIDRIGPSFKLLSTTDIDLDVRPLLPANVSAFAPLFPTEISVGLSGSGLPSSGGTLDVSLKAQGMQNGKEQELLALDAHVDRKTLIVDSLNLNVLGATIHGEGRVAPLGSPETDRVLGSLQITGNAKEVLVELQELGVKVPRGLRLPSELDLSVSLSGSFDDRVRIVVAPSKTRIAGGSVDVRGTAEFQRTPEGMALIAADGELSLRSLKIRQLAHLARKPTPKIRGSVNGDISVHQIGDRRSVTHNLLIRIPQHNVKLRAKGALTASTWKGRVTANDLDSSEELGWLQAEIPLNRRMKLRKRGRMHLRGAIPRTHLRDHLKRLPAAVQTKLDQRISSGTVAVSFELEGSPSKPRGQVEISGDLELKKGPQSNLSTALSLAVDTQADGTIRVKPTGTLNHSLSATPILDIAGAVSLAPGVKRPAKERLSLDLAINLPQRSLQSALALAGVQKPALSELPGEVAAHFKVVGLGSNARLEGEIEVSEIPTMSGATSIRATLDGSRVGGSAQLRIGEKSPLTIDVKAAAKGSKWQIQGQTHASKIALVDLLPKSLSSSLAMVREIPAYLNTDLGIDALVGLAGEKPSLESLLIHGEMKIAVQAAAIPNSSRVLHDVELSIHGEKDNARLQLSAEERDSQEKHRRLAVEIGVRLADLGLGTMPTIKAHVQAEKWLLFGAVLGKVDAPRGVLDTEIRIEAELGTPRPEIDVRVESLVYSEPEREVFIHEFETYTPKGDIVFSDQSDIPVGKLGVVQSTTRLEKIKPALPEVLVRVHAPNLVTIAKGPLNLQLRADVEVPIGFGDGPRGTVEIDNGQIAILGKVFDYDRGEVTLGKVPTANLFFSRKLPPDVVRKLSRRSAGDTVFLHLRPIGGGPVISFSGAGNQNLMQAFSLMHAGRPYVYGQPDLPASSVIRAPEKKQPMTLGFVHTFIPRLHLFDRFGAWSNPYDSFGSWGQLRHLDAEKRFGRSSRFKLVAKPRRIGRSTSEAQLDRLFVDTKSMSLGLGARLGTRLGGGVGVFFEWISAD